MVADGHVRSLGSRISGGGMEEVGSDEQLETAIVRGNGGRRRAKRRYAIDGEWATAGPQGQEERRVHALRGDGERRQAPVPSWVQHHVTEIVPHVCAVCRRPLVRGGDNVLFQVAGRPLFGTHNGDCAEVVRTTTGGAARTVQALLRQRYPKLWNGLRALRGILEAATELEEEKRRHGH